MFSKIHKLSLLIGACSILLPVIFWNKIPDKLPMHYNAAGEVDHWAGKGSLILLFFLIALLMGVMSIAIFFVKTNMESKYSKEAEKSEMRVAYPAIVVMNLIMQLMFAYITFCCVTCRPLGKLFLPSFLVAIFAPIAYVIYKGRGKKTHYEEVEKKGEGKVYRTAVDWWLGLLLGGSEILMIWIAIEQIISENKVSWSTLLPAILLSVFILPLFGIKYILCSEYLLVSMGVYRKTRILYRDIVAIKKTQNPLSSAAMSINRVQIDYVEDGTHRMILISPKGRTEFIEELEERCERSKS